ncbi:P-loop ATPase, Sll1717 family [Lentzea guizhouensis]|uniref:P-loop ATPase, Sll1717 family n=1 Tax=Lentzea guizhouensis TaxID=1586287 RepID=UPI0012B6A346|nr:hypothetical protein [Lentzea guizhouensis]
MKALNQILTTREPFGPADSESVFEAGLVGVDQLFDRSNLIYAQAIGASRPTYIIGRKGAGKTAFLFGSTMSNSVRALRTATVYQWMASVIRRWTEVRGPLFVDQAADIWEAVFEQVALFHVHDTAQENDPVNELQDVWDHLDRPEHTDATKVTERFLAELQRRIANRDLIGLNEIIGDITHGGVTFDQARRAMRAILQKRQQSLVIVMDNLEDLHARLPELRDVLSGMFRCVGRVILGNDAFGVQICLPSELFDQIHEISTAPEKDFRGSYLTIYWTAKELLKLADNRLGLYLGTHHPEQYGELLKKAAGREEPQLLRAALPPRMTSGLGAEEDPLAYLLRHTQLLPRHLIEILNSVFTAPVDGSAPWAVTEEAIRSGTRRAERMVVNGIFAAHQASFPLAREALVRLSDRLGICFAAKDLHRVFNREGIRKATGMEFGEFLPMLFTLGALGVRFDETARYNKAHFQYTFDSNLTTEEDTDFLCFHPLFTRYLHERSLPKLRSKNAKATYPHGCDPADEDYRVSLGYTAMAMRG